MNRDRIAVSSAITDGHVQFRVSDTGEGIAIADQAGIFDRFTRAGSRRPQGSGAGLGLAIVRSIAVAHHGSIDVASSPGQGTAFTLTVPVDQPIDDRSEPVR